MKRILQFIFLLIIGTSCKEVYDLPPQSMLQATFMNSETNKALTLNVSAIGLGLDNYLLKDSTIKTLLFPLKSTDTTNYVVTFDSSIDTITFLHQTFQKYDSMESGFYYEYKLDSIIHTHNRIDSIQITDSLITKKWHENIKLYIRPLPAGSN